MRNPELTTRESEIALLIAQAHSNKEISRALNIAPGTVKMHLANIYQKLGVDGRIQLALHIINRVSA